MGEAAASLPTRSDVSGWSAQQRAGVAQLLEECLTPSAATRRHPARRRLVLTVGAAGALFLLPWLVYLSATLPTHSSGGAWRTVWVGFDVALAGSFAATATAVWYRRQVAGFAMVITATLLTCDAWFDICLSWGTIEHRNSVIAAVVEVPVAMLLSTSAAILMRRTSTVIAQLRGQDLMSVSLWRQSMCPVASTRAQQGATGRPERIAAA